MAHTLKEWRDMCIRATLALHLATGGSTQTLDDWKAQADADGWAWPDGWPWPPPVVERMEQVAQVRWWVRAATDHICAERAGECERGGGGE